MITISTNGSGFTDCQVLVNTLISQLIAGGMQLVYPVIFTPTTYKATLTTAAQTDPLYLSQPWSVQISAESTTVIRVITGTSTQLPSDGTHAQNPDQSIVGHLGQGTIPYTDFIDRSLYSAPGLLASPMSYVLSIAQHGMALSIWEPATDAGTPIMSYFTIQRPVNNRTGMVRITGKSPVYCLYGINRSAVALVNKFVVREADILRPTDSISATHDTSDSFKSINIGTMVAITEESNYVIFFPNCLNTQRYAYPQDDLDLISYTSADVISTGSATSLPVYNEPFFRTYQCLLSNGTDNTGMRILILTN
jgi:hypothetical protein